MPGKDKEKEKRKKTDSEAPRSDPTSPEAKIVEPGPSSLALRGLLTSRNSQRKKIFSGKIPLPPSAPSTLSVDTVELLKSRSGRTAVLRTGSAETHRQSGCSIEECQSSPEAQSVYVQTNVSSANWERPATPVPTVKRSPFKMAHESFRMRMFQEQHGMEPVFMTKKRTRESKTTSEFKGGDLNKYTARSYTIQNGNEVFGGQLWGHTAGRLISGPLSSTGPTGHREALIAFDVRLH
ncbi:hypothetical protein QR680_018246 [Steinernema hermaphroditum]|uniref:Uncharacterized protein n=1 Tax=Steinernema hermaphroditum TaxID=289476 RepID=A0AA39LQS9_9BILA|nr:hypothetical protein QR680_018246 [Steinernema hermaphroditum]